MKHSGRFVAYYPVSTARQGRSGLGLEAKQQAVREHLNGGKWELVAEFTEVESGKRSDRPKLVEALKPPVAVLAHLFMRARSKLADAAADARPVEKGIIIVEGHRVVEICVIWTVIIAIVRIGVWDA
jgi:hypothetical protein